MVDNEDSILAPQFRRDRNLDPRTGTIVHIGYLPHITNAPQLPCRAAIVTAPVRDGVLSVTVFPAFSAPFPAKVESWHSVAGCKR